MRLRKIVRRLVPKSIRLRLHRFDHWLGGTYDDVVVTPDDIRRGDYKQYLGGGDASWDQRGQYQLRLLQWLGLQPHHGILDVGCGPLRAGRFLIRHLEPGKYTGIDYNPSFVEAARFAVEEEGLGAKNPTLAVVQDFDLSGIEGRFDFALAFSVLNHCSHAQREAFFRNVVPRLSDGATLVLTHASWFDERSIDAIPLRLVRTITSQDAEAAGLSTAASGWGGRDDIFPVLQLEKRAG